MLLALADMEKSAIAEKLRPLIIEFIFIFSLEKTIRRTQSLIQNCHCRIQCKLRVFLYDSDRY